jgi:hypothetical protein
MDNSNITYIIHTATTAEELWKALTSPEALKKNWGNIESSWAGFKNHRSVRCRQIAVGGRSTAQRAASADLLYIDVTGMGEAPIEVKLEMGPPASEVSPGESIVQLTLTQKGFRPGSKVFAGCSRAWPEILSSFKTYSETGRPLKFAWKHRRISVERLKGGGGKAHASAADDLPPSEDNRNHH